MTIKKEAINRTIIHGLFMAIICFAINFQNNVKFMAITTENALHCLMVMKKAYI